jgi:hypothetical protein
MGSAFLQHPVSALIGPNWDGFNININNNRFAMTITITT